MQENVIVRHIYDVVNGLKKEGIKITDRQVQFLVNKFGSRTDVSSEAIISEIDRTVEEYVAGIKARDEEFAQLSEQAPNMYNLQNLPLQYNGITLHNQDIDLMMIACSNNPIELQEALDKITNIRVSLGSTEMSDDEFERVREEAYNLYLSTLSSRNDWIEQPGIQLSRKIGYLKASGLLDDTEISALDEILRNNKSVDEIVAALSEQFPGKVHQIFEVVRDFEPIEKEGITSMDVERSRRLAEQIAKNYNSITIDEEAKYGRIVLQDGTFDFRHLSKALDFAKSMGKEVRLNTLLFYMDCPKTLYNLPVSDESRKLVKDKLLRYVDATTKFVHDNYGDVVRSIDVFNELLCRHPLTEEGAILDRERYALEMEKVGLDPNSPYVLRGQLPQDESLYRDFDNVDAGWLKHLSIEDLCDVIAVARRNLPDVDFMYNDDHLTDPYKMPATATLLKQIRQYETEHSVKLIDSIGTQMHVDSNLGSDDFRRMFNNLSKFGLPIEVTEFDLAMTAGVDGLSDKEIELLRLKKIDELHKVILEVSDDCDIRGFTIWSKTDGQNFRIHLENTERIKQGLEPISSLHGGYFGENYELKNKHFSKTQGFNFHTHTNRCGHASIVDDSAYVQAAREQGITRLGFSDHVPLSALEYPDLSNKMHISEVDGYISSIRELRTANPDMEILCGFEAEYDPMKKGFLGELRGRVDYLILGQHYVKDGFKTITGDNSLYYPMVYAESVCEAMETGLFDIVAHPDIFMKYRDTLETESERKIFDEAAESAARKICVTASDLGLPLEINLAEIAKGEKMSDGSYAYPHPLFWKIASEYDVKVLYSADAHDPSQLKNMAALIEKAESVIDVSKLTFVDDDYDPVVARTNNPMLSALFEDSYTDSMTYESHLVYGVLSSAVSGIDEDAENVGAILEESLAATRDVLPVEAEGKKDKARLKYEDISEDESLSDEEKTFALERVSAELKAIEATLGERSAVIDRAIDSVNSATMMGCETAEEYVQVVTDLTEVRSQSDMVKASEASERLVGFEETRQATSDNKDSDKGKTYVYTNDSSDNSNGDGGYAGSVLLFIAVGVLAVISIIMLGLFVR